MLHWGRRGACLSASLLLVASAFLAPGKAADDASKALAAAFNGFGQHVFAALERKPGNIVFSPYSVGVAMAMTMSGARGETQREMLEAIRFTQSPAQIENANGPLAAGLEANGRQLAAQPGPEERCAKVNVVDTPDCIARFPAAWQSPGAPAELEIANALMVTAHDGPNESVSAEYVSLLREKYEAEIFQNAGLRTVNEWAARQTKGKINPLLQQIPEDAAAVILDAVYFKGTWEAPFDKALTKDRPFTLESGEEIQTTTMAITGSFPMVAGVGYRAIRLPYATSGLGMIIVLPSGPKGLAAVGAQLDADGLQKLLKWLDEAPTATLIDMKLPCFKAEFGTSLKEAMQLAGIALAFDPVRANFSGIAAAPIRPGENIYIGDVVHKATIEITEEGTVATAATSARMSNLVGSLVLPKPAPFAVDHPFLFYIADRKSGAILFQGRIEDPRQTTNRAMIE
ncbi:MAG: serpin family protein [Hyphomicrobiales bacterium]